MIRDPSNVSYIKHKLSDILFIVMCGVLSGLDRLRFAKELLRIIRDHWKIESMHWLLDVTFSEDSSQFLSENAHKTMNSLRKFTLAVHKNFLALSGKKRSLKANMLAALISPEFLLDIINFL